MARKNKKKTNITFKGQTWKYPFKVLGLGLYFTPEVPRLKFL